jgi:hypothetical protein
MSKDDGNYSLAKLARGVLESASDKATTNDVNTILKSYIPVNGLKEGCTRHDENFIVHLSSVNTSISFYLGSDVKLRCYGAGVGSTIRLLVIGTFLIVIPMCFRPPTKHSMEN